ncbi:MAG: hypothetical protein KKD94_04065 [Nanoarchaeota archaeon]|nr:hypothetical protein [Nanoarchaeota archaeon]
MNRLLEVAVRVGNSYQSLRKKGVSEKVLTEFFDGREKVSELEEKVGESVGDEEFIRRKISNYEVMRKVTRDIFEVGQQIVLSFLASPTAFRRMGEYKSHAAGEATCQLAVVGAAGGFGASLFLSVPCYPEVVLTYLGIQGVSGVCEYFRYVKNK